MILDRELNVLLVVVLPLADAVESDKVLRVDATRGNWLCRSRQAILLSRRCKWLVNQNRMSVANHSLDGSCVPNSAFG